MPEQQSITEPDLAALGRAKRLLENPGFIAKAADAVGTPIDILLQIARTWRRFQAPYCSNSWENLGDAVLDTTR